MLGRGPHPPQSSIFAMVFAGFSVLYDDVKLRVDMYGYVPMCEYMYQFIVVVWICSVYANSGKG